MSAMALLFMALASACCYISLANDGERRSILLGEKIKTENKVVLYNTLGPLGKSLVTYCDKGDEHRALLVLKAGQNRTWGFTEMIDPSTPCTCTLTYSYYKKLSDAPKYVTTLNIVEFDLLRTREVYRHHHRCKGFCAWYANDDGIYLRNPRNMKDIFRVEWQTSTP